MDQLFLVDPGSLDQNLSPVGRGSTGIGRRNMVEMSWGHGEGRGDRRAGGWRGGGVDGGETRSECKKDNVCGGDNVDVFTARKSFQKK
jgi:hypothetical protein